MIFRGGECAEASVGDVPGEAQPGLALTPGDLNYGKTLGFVKT